MNDVIKNTVTVSASTNYESGFIDLLNVHNLYILSPNLGGFSALGPRGESNIVRKVPVNSNFGYVITNRIKSNIDYIDVSKQSLRAIEFKLTDAKGNIVQLHGSNWSCSLLFCLLSDINIL